MKKISNLLALVVGVSIVLSTVVMPINVSATADVPLVEHFDFTTEPNDFSVTSGTGCLTFEASDRASYELATDPIDDTNKALKVTLEEGSTTSSGSYVTRFLTYTIDSDDIVDGSYYFVSARLLAAEDLTNVTNTSATIRTRATGSSFASQGVTMSTTSWATSRAILFSAAGGDWNKSCTAVPSDYTKPSFDHYIDDYRVHEIRALTTENLGTASAFKLTGPEDLGLIKEGITITDTDGNSFTPQAVSYADGVWSISYSGLDYATDYQLIITSVFNETDEGAVTLKQSSTYEKRMIFDFTTEDAPVAFTAKFDFTQAPDFSVRQTNNEGKIYFIDGSYASYEHAQDPLDSSNKAVKVTLQDAAKNPNSSGYYKVQYAGYDLPESSIRDGSYYFVSARILANQDLTDVGSKSASMRAVHTSSATASQSATLSTEKWSTSRAITYANGHFDTWNQTYMQVTGDNKSVSVDHYFDDYRVYEILTLTPGELDTTGVFRLTGPEDLGLIKEGITITDADGTNSFTPDYVWYSNGIWNIAYDGLSGSTNYQLIITSVFNGTDEGAIALTNTGTYEKRMIFDFVTSPTNLLEDVTTLSYSTVLASGQATLEASDDAWLYDRSAGTAQAALASVYLTPGATYSFKAKVKYADSATTTTGEYANYYLPSESEVIYDRGSVIGTEYTEINVIFKYLSTASSSEQNIGVCAPDAGTDNLLIKDLVLEQIDSLSASGEVECDTNSATLTYYFSQNIDGKITAENIITDNDATVSDVQTYGTVCVVELTELEKDTDYTVTLSNVVNGIGQQASSTPLSFATYREFSVTSVPENGAGIHNSDSVTLTFTNKPTSLQSGTDVIITKGNASVDFSITTVSEDEENGEFVYTLDITNPEYNNEYCVAINVEDESGQTINKTITFILTSPSNLLNVWKNTSGQVIGGTFEHSDYVLPTGATDIQRTEAAAYEGNYGLSFTASSESQVAYTGICPDWTYEQVATKEQNNVLFVSFYAKAAAGSGNPVVSIFTSNEAEQTNILTTTYSSAPTELNENSWVKVTGFVMPKQNADGENSGFNLGILVSDNGSTTTPTIYADNFEVVEITRLNLDTTYMAHTSLSSDGTLEVTLDNSDKQNATDMVFVVAAVADETGRLNDIKLQKVDWTEYADCPATVTFTNINENYKLYIWDEAIRPIVSEMSLNN